MNNDVIPQPNDIMVCSFSPSVFVKKVKYLYSATQAKLNKQLTVSRPLIISPNETSKYVLHSRIYAIQIYFKEI